MCTNIEKWWLTSLPGLVLTIAPLVVRNELAMEIGKCNAVCAEINRSMCANLVILHKFHRQSVALEYLCFVTY